MAWRRLSISSGYCGFPREQRATHTASSDHFVEYQKHSACNPNLPRFWNRKLDRSIKTTERAIAWPWKEAVAVENFARLLAVNRCRVEKRPPELVIKVFHGLRERLPEMVCPPPGTSRCSGFGKQVLISRLELGSRYCCCTEIKVRALGRR